MRKAFLYDSLCGMVCKCMFAGLDEYGHAQWVNITPGEEPKTLNDFVRDEELDDMRFFVLAMDGETAPSKQVAKVLGLVAESPITELSTELLQAVRRMEELGVKWDKMPLELVVKVFENPKTGRCQGKYSYWVEDKNCCCTGLAHAGVFETLEDLFQTVRTYFTVLETTAGIPLLSKDLSICDKLKKEMKKADLDMFGHK